MFIPATYPWKRYWIKQGEQPAMDAGLFVEPVEKSVFTNWFAARSNGFSLRDLRAVPCLVLLGDVGMGKSTTIQQEAEALQTALAGQKHEVVYEDLKRLSETQIDRRIFQSSQVEGWSQGEHALTLFLDSLDECWRRIEALELLLVDELERRIRKETPALFLRVACRSAEWRGDAGKAFAQLLPKEAGLDRSVQVFVLAPLSANNVREAAASKGRDGERLLERITAKGTQALASHPMTFEMLLQIFQTCDDFPTSRMELYREGVLRLCADDNVVFGNTRQPKTTPRHRFAIAARLAAVSVLTNRYLVNGDFEHPVSRPDVLEVSEVVGYAEEQTAGEHVVVDRDTIAETLRTALFADRVEGAQTWRHQSYAEFLAAHYLGERRWSVSQAAAALTDTTDNAQRIIPQLEETACWMAEMVPGLFAALATHNADVFLRCAPIAWSADDRAVLVESYLALVRRHEAPELEWQLQSRFAGLAHTGLANQLRSSIAVRAEYPLVREAAIDIAGYCKLTALAPELIRVLLDVDDRFEIRRRAADALWRSANDDIRSRLGQEGVKAWAGDSEDELKGCYLRIMWPARMSLDALLSTLTPARWSRLGSYKMFLEYELPKSLSDTDLPRVLDWLREGKVGFDVAGAFGSFPSKLFTRALTRIDDPSVRNAIVRLLSIDDCPLYSLFHERGEQSRISPEVRLSFWKAVIESSLDIQKLINHADMKAAHMLVREDSLAFIAEYRIAPEGPVRDRWRMLIFSVFAIEDTGTLEALSGLAREDPAIATFLVARTSCTLFSDPPHWEKLNYEWRLQNTHPDDAAEPAFVELVVSALDEFETGKVEAYWRTVELLDMDPQALGFSGSSIRLSEEKAWKCLPPEVRQRILRGAPRYLEVQPVDDTQVWDSQQRYRPYDIVVPLLVLLFDEDNQALMSLTKQQWSKWIGVFVAYSARRNGNHEKAYGAILTLAYSKAQEAFLGALRRHLWTHVNDASERRIVWDLRSIWCTEIKVLLEELLFNKPPTPTAAHDILQFLIAQEPGETENSLAALIDEANRGDKCSVHLPSAIAMLIAHSPKTWGAPLVQQIGTDHVLGRAVVPFLIRGDLPSSAWLSQIPPGPLAQFWEWLEEQYPRDPHGGDDRTEGRAVAYEVFPFRSAVFQAWTHSGQPEACDVMEELMRRRPNDFWLGNVLAKMRTAARRTQWVRPSPSALMCSLAATEKRIIGTAGELHAVIIESLRQFEAELHGTPPSMELWNETRKGKVQFWQPKDEMSLSNCLKRFLERDLSGRGVLAGREVQIRPRLGEDPAQLVDLLVQAIPIGENGHPDPKVSVVVEVKCAWNQGVMADMERQLFSRYLKNSEMHFGIYAVAYFTCKAWNWETDARKTDGESGTEIGTLRTKLSIQAASLSSVRKRVESIVIDARLSD